MSGTGKQTSGRGGRGGRDGRGGGRGGRGSPRHPQAEAKQGNNKRHEQKAQGGPTVAAPKPAGHGARAEAKPAAQQAQHNSRRNQPGNGSGASNEQMRQSIAHFEASESIQRFCRGLVEQQQSAGRLISNAPQLWTESFDCAARSVEMGSFAELLLKIYLQLPDQELISPNPASALLVLRALLCSNSATSAHLHLVLDVSLKLTRLPSMSKITNKDAVLAALDQLQTAAQQATTRLLPRNYLEILNYSMLLEKFFSDYRRLVTDLVLSTKSVAADDEPDLPLFMQWSQSPTIKWLQDAEWLRFPALKGQYDSVESYCLTMRGLWTALSFYWGAAALVPRCHYREGGPGKRGDDSQSSCLSPLLALPHRGEHCSMRVRAGNGETRICGNAAQWCCYRRGHDAICSTCLDKKRPSILGPPNNRDSSTDIYDAVVSGLSVRNDSTVLHLGQATSRKPPEKDINWPTSYRLQPTSFVGIVSLPASCMPLEPHLRIQWGEIVAKDGTTDRDEFARRRLGQLSVRLLTRNDSLMLSNQFDANFTTGCKLAIIDLRVFVPEVISVLSTISSPSFEQSLRMMPFSPLLLGQLPAIDHRRLLSAEESLHVHVDEAVRHSCIKSIQHFSDANKQELITKICQIPNVITMDTTQRDAFCAALQSSVHCTQGPPGTGKSYTGVAVVLALQHVRAIVRRNGGNVGPIIALSYKNHALDEFLVDVLKSNGFIRQGELIRLGRPENPALSSYTERYSDHETAAKKLLEQTLKVIKQCTVTMQQCMFPVDRSTLPLLMKCIGYCQTHADLQLAEDLASLSAFDCLDRFQATDAIHTFAGIVLASLVGPAEHWTGQDPRNALHEWLQGSIPPPRCSKMVRLPRDGAVQQCWGIAASPGLYCREHKCRQAMCQGPAEDGVGFCLAHCCAVDQCRTPCHSPSTFCAEHTCSYCLDHPVLPFCPACPVHMCSIPGCNQAQLLPLQVCVVHKCQLCNSVVDELCQEIGGDGFCTKHKCAAEDCYLPVACCPKRKLIGKYCCHHTCFKCLEDGTGLGEETFPPRNTCAKHVLCQFMSDAGEECMDLVEADNMYCPAHMQAENVMVICCGVTTKGKPCKAKKPQSEPYQHPWYCTPHLTQRPQQAPLKKATAPTKHHVADLQIVDLPDGLRDSGQLPPRAFCCSHVGCAVLTAHNNPYWMCAFHDALKNQSILHTNEVAAEALPQVNDMVEDAAPAATIPVTVVPNAAPQPGKKADVPTKRPKADDDYELVDDEDYLPVVDMEVAGDADEMEMRPMHFDTDNALITKPPGDAVVEEEDDDGGYEKNEDRNELYRSDSDSEDEDAPLQITDPQGITPFTADQTAKILEKCAQWTWDMPPSERINQVQDFMSMMGGTLRFLLERSADHVDEVRKARAEANAAVLKKAAVIGGTVVGAAKRLPALRAAGPFAIIVEEACEVMEPTLIAVLAVDSLEKLELIGDHRQLPAYINNNWYNFEITVPKIKKSLFERLIDNDTKANGTAQGLCTVLDVQRRMKPYISDITRSHYSDVVAIVDHPSTLTQCIGDRVLKKGNDKSPLRMYRALWFDKGRSVPGIRRNLFFWDLPGNIESRPKAGLSACNETEAAAVGGLTKYLQFCGVPDSSITIITPYQGQKRTIIQTLRAMGCIPKFNHASPAPMSEISISTVDRYQGDENDIVILSLVRTKPGNRFVSLLNRFIVATSRARIGFFIIGTTKAVTAEGAGGQDLKHWQGFLDRLRDNHGPEGDRDAACIGGALPICCPQHAESIGSVGNAHDSFPNTVEKWCSICTVPCTVALACGHPCDLPCHVGNISGHNKKCMVPLPRACNRHEETVPCNEISTAGWKCSIVNEYDMPHCEHRIKLPCYQYSKILSGAEAWPECVQPVQDFVHPVCNHVFSKLTCAVRRQYETKAPRCERKVIKQRDCQHHVQVFCSDVNLPLPSCKEGVDICRPRCGHKLSMRCTNSRSLLSAYAALPDMICEPSSVATNAGRMVELDEIEHCYGPAETSLAPSVPPCGVAVLIKRQCSHQLELPCHEAFATITACSLPKCQKPVTLPCFLCRSRLQVSCSDEKEFQALPTLSLETMLNAQGVLREEALLGTKDAMAAHLLLLSKMKCSAKVKVERACQAGHILELPCMELVKVLLGKKPLPLCKQQIQQQRDCGHSITRHCHQRGQAIDQVCNQIVYQKFSFPDCQHSITVKTCGEWQALVADPHPICTESIHCTLYRCGHEVETMCFNQQNCILPADDSDVTLSGTDQRVISSESYCQPCADAPVCKQPVDFVLTCEHVINQVPCDEAFSWTLGSGGKEPLCNVLVPFASPLCEHDLQVHCCDHEELTAWRPWIDGSGCEQVTTGANGEQISAFHFPFPVQPVLPAAVMACLPSCQQSVVVIFDACAHLRRVKCCELFAAKPLECEDIMPVKCAKPTCGHVRELTCAQFRRLSPLELEEGCTFKQKKTCAICKVNQLEVSCNERHPSCNAMVRTVLPCGHNGEWKCTDGSNDLRNSHEDTAGYNKLCKKCAHQRWEIASELDFDVDLLRAVLMEKMAQVLPNCLLKKITDMEVKLQQHEGAMNQSIKRIQDHLNNNTKPAKDNNDPIPWPCIGEDAAAFVREHFQLVYLSIPAGKEANLDNIRSNRLQALQTQYGLGLAIQMCTQEAIEASISVSSSTSKLCVGLAFVGHLLTDKEPFRATRPTKDQAKVSESEKQQRASAHRLVGDFQKRGYDAVQAMLAGQPTGELIFWHKFAVIPLAIVELEVQNQCMLCFNAKPKEGRCGAVCRTGHFVCWDEDCFGGYLSSAQDVDRIASYVNDKGDLCCPHPDCKQPYDVVKLAAYAPPAISNELIQLKCRFQAQQEVDKAVKEEAKRHEQELKKVMEMADEQEREAYFLLRHVRDNILTMRCPNPQCRRAFEDFDGCFALSCSGAGGCEIQFCAWCLHYGGGDMHGHVAQCRLGNRNVYGNRDLLKGVWNQRRERELRAYVANKTPAVKRKLLHDLKKDLQDLGMVIAEL